MSTTATIAPTTATTVSDYRDDSSHHGHDSVYYHGNDGSGATEVSDTTVRSEVAEETTTTVVDTTDEPEAEEEAEVTLPFTGFDHDGPVAFAAVALAAGTGLVVLTRTDKSDL